MKRNLSIVLSIVLSLLLIMILAACSSGSSLKDTAGQSDSTGSVFGSAEADATSSSDTNDSDSGSASEKDGTTEIDAEDFDAATALLSKDQTKWPADRVHPDMPEYSKGKMNAWSQWTSTDVYSIFLLVRETSEADMQEYEEQLVAAGFEKQGSDRYHKDLFDVELQMNSDTILQISSYKTETVEWPSELSAIPPIQSGALSSVDGPEDEYPNSMMLYYINTKVEDLRAWGQLLAAKGFTVDGDSISSGSIQFNGKQYSSASIWYEENGDNEWMIYFDFME